MGCAASALVPCGKYSFYLDDDNSDDAYVQDYEFDEEEACSQWDYYNEREARRDAISDEEPDDEPGPCPALDVRFKYLPDKFRIQSSLDFLQSGVAKNLTLDAKNYIHSLRRIQQYMVPLVLNEFPFMAMGPAGSGKTTGYLLPLVNKLVERKEVEVRGRRGPIALIVTHTEGKIKHIRELCCRYSRGTSLMKYFTTTGELDIQTSLSTSTVFDVACAPAPALINAINKFQMPLNRVRFVVIEEFHFCTNDSEYKESLSAFKTLLSKHGVKSLMMARLPNLIVVVNVECGITVVDKVPPILDHPQPVYFFISLVPEEKMFDVTFMEELAGVKVARLIAGDHIDGITVGVLPVSIFHRLFRVWPLFGEGASNRKSVVMVSDPRRAHFLACLLCLHDVSATFITRNDNLLDAETAVRQWRMDQRRVLVADYDSLKELDYGFVETCILFEPPDADFCSFHKRFLDLGAKLSHKRRLYILLNTEMDDGAASCVIEFLESLNQPLPQFLVDMAESAGDPLSESDTSTSSYD